jgi:hypothetical protein
MLPISWVGWALPGAALRERLPFDLCQRADFAEVNVPVTNRDSGQGAGIDELGDGGGGDAPEAPVQFHERYGGEGAVGCGQRSIAPVGAVAVANDPEAVCRWDLTDHCAA